MQNVIIYTKRYELKFDENNSTVIDLTSLIEELYEEYVFLDPHPIISIEGNYQLVSFKLAKKDVRKKIGF